MKNKHLKPIYWGLFSAGGTVAAFSLAALILAFSFILPFQIISTGSDFYHKFHGFISHKLVFLILTGLVFTILWHAVHRFYYILHDMHIHVGNKTRLSFYAFACLAFLITLICTWL